VHERRFVRSWLNDTVLPFATRIDTPLATWATAESKEPGTMTDTTRTSYTDACAAAATRQGLDPVVAALTDAGLVPVVEQTGGFTMVVAVYAKDGTVVVTDDGGYLVGQFAGDTWHDGPDEAAVYTFDLTLDQMVAAVTEHIAAFGGALHDPTATAVVGGAVLTLGPGETTFPTGALDAAMDAADGIMAGHTVSPLVAVVDALGDAGINWEPEYPDLIRVPAPNGADVVFDEVESGTLRFCLYVEGWGVADRPDDHVEIPTTTPVAEIVATVRTMLASAAR
jgi:hypothetical protein